MANLNKDEISKVLEEIFKQMEKCGLKISGEGKKNIIHTLADELQNALSKDDVKDKNVQKKLISCIASKIMGDEKGLKNMVNVLNSGQKKSEDNTLDAKLGIVLKFIQRFVDVKELKKHEKKPELQAFKELLLEMVLKPALKKNAEKKNPQDEAALQKQLEKDMDLFLRNLYGGQNPTMNGEIAFPVLGPIIGNVFGFTNQCSADPTSNAEMVDLITENPGKVDPLGIENIAHIADIAIGEAVVSNLPDAEPSYQTPNPFNTKLKPPGS